MVWIIVKDDDQYKIAPSLHFHFTALDENCVQVSGFIFEENRYILGLA